MKMPKSILRRKKWQHGDFSVRKKMTKAPSYFIFPSLFFFFHRLSYFFGKTSCFHSNNYTYLIASSCVLLNPSRCRQITNSGLIRRDLFSQTSEGEDEEERGKIEEIKFRGAPSNVNSGRNTSSFFFGRWRRSKKRREEWPRMDWFLVLYFTASCCLVVCSDLCPPECVCIWKSGKETTECQEQNFKDIPNGIEPATQVRT